MKRCRFLPCKQNPLQTSREYRSESWWLTMCAISSQTHRRKEGIRHRSQGHHASWDDIFVKTMGIHWRHTRDSCGNLRNWMDSLGGFLKSASRILGIYAPQEPGHVVRALDSLQSTSSISFDNVPPLPPHPEDPFWDGGSH